VPGFPEKLKIPATITSAFPVIAKETEAAVAVSQLALPPELIVIVHVPSETIVIVSLELVHTELGDVEKVKFAPEKFEEAEMANGFTDIRRSDGLVTLIP
jgi:hypothetical protein